jgi:hypothetical protein
MWFVKKSEILSLIDRECLDEVLPSFSDHRTIRKNETIYRPVRARNARATAPTPDCGLDSTGTRVCPSAGTSLAIETCASTTTST